MEEHYQRMWTNFFGRTFVDPNSIFRDPKVQRMLEKLSEANKSMRGKPGITFLKPRKSDG